MMIFNKLFGKYKFITMSAIILALICGIVAVLVHFYVPDIKTDSKTTNTNANSQTEADINDDVLAGDSSILLVCNSETIGKAMFMTLLDFHIFAETIVVTPLDMTVSDGLRSYAESYSYGGINELIKSVENVRNCKIDRYITVNKSGISEFTDIMGKVGLYVTEDYTYAASDKSYAVSAGNNELEADMLYAYLKIICEKYDTAKLADLLCTIINLYLPEVAPEDAQNLFGELCNCVTTNITISDYYTCSSDIEYLLTHNTKCVTYDKGE